MTDERALRDRLEALQSRHRELSLGNAEAQGEQDNFDAQVAALGREREAQMAHHARLEGLLAEAVRIHREALEGPVEPQARSGGRAALAGGLLIGGCTVAACWLAFAGMPAVLQVVMAAAGALSAVAAATHRSDRD